MNKQRFKSIIMVFSFVLFIYFPYYTTIALLIIKPQLIKDKSSTFINALKPNVTKLNFKKFTESIELNLVLGLPLSWRQYISSYVSKYKYILFRTIVSRSVTRGKNDWLFFSSQTDGDLLNDYQGKFEIDQNINSKLINNLSKNLSKLQLKKIKLTIFVLPNKGQIYSKYLPDKIKLSTNTKTDYLVNLIKEQIPLINCVYPKNEMLKKADDFELYFPKDTHYTNLGAYLACRELMKQEFNIKMPELEKIKIEKKIRNRADDMVRMLGLENYLKPSIDYYLENCIYKEGQIINSITYFKNPTPTMPLKVLIVGDSYRNSIIPCLYSYFSCIAHVHRNDYSIKIIEEFKPDWIILEAVGRHIPNFLSIEL